VGCWRIKPPSTWLFILAGSCSCLGLLSDRSTSAFHLHAPPSRVAHFTDAGNIGCFFGQVHQDGSGARPCYRTTRLSTPLVPPCLWSDGVHRVRWWEGDRCKKTSTRSHMEQFLPSHPGGPVGRDRKYVCEYLAKTALASPSINWGIAGRNQGKLEVSYAALWSVCAGHLPTHFPVCYLVLHNSPSPFFFAILPLSRLSLTPCRSRVSPPLPSSSSPTIRTHRLWSMPPRRLVFS
jgi:hypothetical protein